MIFFLSKVFRPWDELPREVMESLSLELSQSSLDVALGDMDWGHAGGARGATG